MIAFVQTAEELDSALVAAESGADGGTANEPSRAAAPRDLLHTPTLNGLLLLALREWALIVLAWIAMWNLPGVLYPLIALFIGGRLHALGVVLHDFTHMPLRKRSAVGTLVEMLCGYPIATTMLAMRYHHLRHHRDSGMTSDPYFKKDLSAQPWRYVVIWLRHILLIPLWTLRPIVGFIALVYKPARNVYGKGWLQDRSGADLKESLDVVDCAKAELGQFLFQSAIVVAACFYPQAVFYFYLLPAAAAGLLAGYRVLREHNYERTIDRRISTIMRTTNDHGLDSVGRWLTAPLHIGNHVVHHIHPQVRLQALPALRAWYMAKYPTIYG